MAHIFRRMTRTMLAACLATSAGIAAALAHHGWNWAQEEQTTMTGTVIEVYVGPPHPRIEIETAEEGNWTIDLGNPNQTANAGFDETSASPGDEIEVLGHRSLDESESLMKAVRVTIDGQDYDFYPDRILE